MTDKLPAPEAAVPIDQDAMSVTELAQAVLDRKIRPRIGSVRRLAEAALTKPTAKKKKKPTGNAKSGKKKAKRKVAKIAKAKKE